jgi:predicted ATP-dependent endonuclease of OLD family
VALTTFVAVQDETRDLVLLIDEAETHLHHDAQADLVRVFGLQRAADSIIYTTHSAGCLPEDLGTGIRVVRRTSDTRSDVSNSFWIEGGGFSPLLLGMGASALVFSAVRRAVVAEGATDLILLPSLLREATGRRELGYQIAPGVAEVSRSSVRDLELEAAQVAYVVDDDKGGKGHADKLAKAGIGKNRILVLGRGVARGMAAEDLVRKDVYLRAVNQELSRSGRPSLLVAADLPARGRSVAVRIWAKKRGYSEPKKVNIAQAIELEVEPEGPVLTNTGARVLRAFDVKTRDLFGMDS